MPRVPLEEPSESADEAASSVLESEDQPGGVAASGSADPSLAGLSIAGITRRRAAFLLLALVTIWIVAVFARQVGDASAATSRADAIRDENARLSTTVDSLQAELRLIQKQDYIQQQARAYGLGTPRERAFALTADAPALPSDAPGSAAVRLGAVTNVRSPLETWLSLLFGPTPTR